MSSKQNRRNKAQERQEKAAKRAPYDSDLSDTEWKRIAPLFKREKKDGRGRPPSTPFREIAGALCCLSRTGRQWRLLPHDFPDWHFVYQWFRQWCGDETLVKINTALRLQTKGWTLETVHRIADAGFKILPHRWKVERTFASIRLRSGPANQTDFVRLSYFLAISYIFRISSIFSLTNAPWVRVLSQVHLRAISSSCASVTSGKPNSAMVTGISRSRK